jgi:hypothetical protein
MGNQLYYTLALCAFITSTRKCPEKKFHTLLFGHQTLSVLIGDVFCVAKNGLLFDQKRTAKMYHWPSHQCFARSSRLFVEVYITQFTR